MPIYADELEALQKAENPEVGQMVVDPPNGWKYGFPKPLRENYTLQLLQAGYPLDMIPLALKYSRYWERAD